MHRVQPEFFYHDRNCFSKDLSQRFSELVLVIRYPEIYLFHEYASNSEQVIYIFSCTSASMLIIDTCSWNKIKRLEADNVIFLKDFFYEGDLHATHELVKEYSHYLENYLDFSRFTIQPVNLQSYHDLTERELDDADLSIIALARMDENTTVICDDGAEMDVLHFFHVKAFKVSEYMLWLVENDLIRKNDGNRVVKKLREWKNIDEHAKKRVLQEINLA